jgi:hypothetical protein
VGGPKRVARGEKAVFTVTVEGGGYTPDGRVTIKVAGKKVTKQLKNGVARLRVAMTRLGENKVVVRYSGDDLTTSRKKVLRVRVVR